MVASHSRVPPYWADTAGPNSHSPEPTDDPASMMPGPSNRAQDFQDPPGGGGRSPTSQAGSAPAGRVSPSSPTRGVEIVVMTPGLVLLGEWHFSEGVTIHGIALGRFRVARLEPHP